MMSLKPKPEVNCVDAIAGAKSHAADDRKLKIENRNIAATVLEIEIFVPVCLYR